MPLDLPFGGLLIDLPHDRQLNQAGGRHRLIGVEELLHDVQLQLLLAGSDRAR